MEELFSNSNTQNIFAQLGTHVGNDYVPSDDCRLILMHIYQKLNATDNSAIHFRKKIGFSQLLRKDLLPMFIAVKNDVIVEILLKILVTLISPIESLILVENNGGEEVDRSAILMLISMLSSSKIAWAELKGINRIMQIIREHIKKLTDYPGCTNSYSISIISDCLCLIKNILHIPNEQYQNNILQKIFSEQFDEIIISLIANSNRGHWAVLIIELIALIFKNQHVEEMSKQFIKMNETITFDDSDDSESNTSSLNLKSERNFSPENTSELSKAEDNDTNMNVIPIKENNESNLMDEHNNSSNEDLKHSLTVKTVKDKLETKPILEGPLLLAQHKLKKGGDKEKRNYKNSSTEFRRNSIKQIKLELKNENYKATLENSIHKRKVKTRKTKNLNTKLKLSSVFVQYHKSNEIYISYFLQKFTVRFLQNGFNTLLDELFNLFTSNARKNLDTSLYFWILTYFCRFCKSKNIKMKLVRRVVSFKLISFIVDEGLKISEELIIAKRQKSPYIHLQVRHLHLAVMAMKEVIKTIDFYRQSSVGSPMYADLIKYLQCNIPPDSISWANDLKSLFTSLIRHYDSNIQVIEYLHDLIITNHMVLSLFHNLKDCWNLDDIITAYIQKFAVPEIMYKYGIVLHNYEQNKEMVNESVFLMMHNIISEVENDTALYQPIILKTFLIIFKQNGFFYRRWSDLIEYTLSKFLILPCTKSCSSQNALDGIPCDY